MAVSVLIPTNIRNLTDDEDTVTTSPGTLDEVISALDTEYPGVKARLSKPDGSYNRFVNFYVNGEDIRFLEGPSTIVRDGDEISIVLNIAGG